MSLDFFFCLCCRCQGGTLTTKNCYVFIYFLFLCRFKTKFQSSRGESGRTLFSLVFVGNQRMPVPRKAPKAQNRSEKLGSWKGPKNHNSFLAYKTSGFVRWSKTLETEEAGTPKVYKKRPSILSPN